MKIVKMLPTITEEEASVIDEKVRNQLLNFKMKVKAGQRRAYQETKMYSFSLLSFSMCVHHFPYNIVRDSILLVRIYGHGR